MQMSVIKVKIIQLQSSFKQNVHRKGNFNVIQKKPDKPVGEFTRNVTSFN